MKIRAMLRNDDAGRLGECAGLPRLAIAACLVLASLSLWLRAAVPIHALSFAQHDDLLFVRLAHYLGAGSWLGPYDSLTLAKGMAYPAFIVAAFAGGIPLKLAEQGLYLGAAGIAAWLVARLTDARWLAVLLFGYLAFDSVLWTGNLARIIREGSYIGLSLMLVMLTAAILFIPTASRFTAKRVALLLAVGVCGGAYWLTRDEGVWLVPVLALLVVAGSINAWRRSAENRRPERIVRDLAGAAAETIVASVAFAAVLAAVAGMNYRHYGEFITNEFQATPFRAAYGALARIRPEEWQRFMVFPKDAREKAYSVSDAARELRPTLDGPMVKESARGHCARMRIEPCTGVPAGWFAWSLRDAVADAGYYTSASAARAFYERLAAEVNQACDAGRIACTAERATLAPPFRWQYLADSVPIALQLGWYLSRSGDGEIGAPPSHGSQYMLERFADVAGPLARAPAEILVLRGTAKAIDSVPRLSVRDRDNAPYVVDLRMAPQSHPTGSPGSQAMEFELITGCFRPSCELVINWGTNERIVPIPDIAAGPLVATAEAGVSIDQVLRRGRGFGNPLASEVRRDIQLRLMRAIGKVYAVTTPILAILAVCGVVLAMALPRRASCPEFVPALTLACGGAVAARLVLLAYIDASSFPAANLLYASPASPFLLMFIVLGLYLGGRTLLGASQSTSRRPIDA
jgi:hypothetical protein